ncbi:MAG: AAA family ATPase [Microthrixaceae bacterium]
MHRPEILFLDEPSAGLDPASRRNLWDVIRSARRDDTTVVLTTHHMDEAEQLCDRVAIMDRGKILAVDTPAELVRQLDAPTRLMLPPDAMLVEDARTLDGVDSVEHDTGALTLITRRPADVLQLLAGLRALDGLQVRSGTLEDVFISMTGRQLSSSDESPT